jgi:hypothetical protein
VASGGGHARASGRRRCGGKRNGMRERASESARVRRGRRWRTGFGSRGRPCAVVPAVRTERAGSADS